jgi:hypothetical protein
LSKTPHFDFSLEFLGAKEKESIKSLIGKIEEVGEEDDKKEEEERIGDKAKWLYEKFGFN